MLTSHGFFLKKKKSKFLLFFSIMQRLLVFSEREKIIRAHIQRSRKIQLRTFSLSKISDGVLECDSKMPLIGGLF